MWMKNKAHQRFMRNNKGSVMKKHIPKKQNTNVARRQCKSDNEKNSEGIKKETETYH